MLGGAVSPGAFVTAGRPLTSGKLLGRWTETGACHESVTAPGPAGEAEMVGNVWSAAAVGCGTAPVVDGAANTGVLDSNSSVTGMLGSLKGARVATSSAGVWKRSSGFLA